ncbi:hypothetical protein ACQKKK_25985 [Peribacillus sp. NPDC006672]|uniref:hypothetical protein n=1 Tax=Peribacillus sp. NPDC006672 TaxID=3390606 RepID=UPI003CFF47A7
MSIRDLFNGSQNNANSNEIENKIIELEKQVKRINAHEVQLMRLRKLEEQVGLMSLKINVEKRTSKTKNQSQSIKSEELESIEKNLKLKLKNIIDEKITPIYQKVNDLYKYIDQLQQKITFLEKILEESNPGYHTHNHRENTKINDLYKHIDQLQQKITFLEKNLEENNSEYHTHNHKENTKMNVTKETPVIFQEIKVDKVFIDKYEQTNNLGQLGIKQLSGHLNIGTTYEKGIIPHELIEDWKQEMEKARNMKKEELEEEKMQHQDRDVNSQTNPEDGENIIIE